MDWDADFCYFGGLASAGYSTFTRKRALPGTECPAAQRFFWASISFIHSGSLLPEPTSNNEPTIALTILRKKRFAVTVNT